MNLKTDDKNIIFDVVPKSRNNKNKSEYSNIFISDENGPIDILTASSTRENLLLYSLISFYRKPNTLSEIIPIVKGETQKSLRIFEWLILTFAKENDTMIIIRDANKKLIKFVHIYQSYKNNLKSYHGEYFSLYKRTKEIRLNYTFQGKNDFIDITIAQLNLFRWMIEDCVLIFLQNNIRVLASYVYKSKKKLELIDDEIIIDTKIKGEIGKNNIELLMRWDNDNKLSDGELSDIEMNNNDGELNNIDLNNNNGNKK